jgi:hypothetical protein
MKKKLLQEQREKAIIANFAKTFNKIKRLEENYIDEIDLFSYKETQSKLKEFAEGLKAHLEKNGYTVLDNPGSDFDKPLIENKKNIIFAYDEEILLVYYANNNEEAISSIIDYYNSNKQGINGGRGLKSKYTTYITFANNPVIENNNILKEDIDGSIFDYTQSELEQMKKDGKIADYVTFYPELPSGSAFTIASDQDVRKMRDMLNRTDIHAYSVGFGPYFHSSGNREPKSMVVILQDAAHKKIVSDIISRHFNWNYPH